MTEALMEDWLATLGDAASVRARAIIELYPEWSEKVCADMSVEHAPFALELLMLCVDGFPDYVHRRSGDYVGSLLDEQDPDFLSRHGPAILAGKEAVSRMVSAGATYEDLGLFATVTGLSAMARLLRFIGRENFNSNLPGWRLMELYEGEPTGRSLFKAKPGVVHEEQVADQ